MAVVDEGKAQQQLEDNEFHRIWIESFRWLPMALLAVLFVGAILIIEMVLQKPRYVDVKFPAAKPGLSADEQTLSSIRRMGDLFVVDYKGDYEARLRTVADWHVRASSKANGPTAPRSCSLFSAPTRMGGQLLGRNLDRRDLPVLVRYAAPGKYRSFGFDPFVDSSIIRVNGNRNATSEDRERALSSLPFYVTDGMNEKGLAIGLADTPARTVQHDGSRTPTFVLLFIRRALDSCKNVDEVAQLAQSVDIYDQSINTISRQFMATDANGEWLVIDYPNGKLRLTRGRGTQVRTNQFVDGAPAEAASVDASSPERYETLTRALERKPMLGSDTEAMGLLEKVYNGTAWSVVYDTQTKTGLVVPVGKYRKQYRFGFDK